MPRPKDTDGMFWVTAAGGPVPGAIVGDEGARVYIRAGEDLVIVGRADGTLIITKVGKVLCTERAAIVRNRVAKALGKKVRP